MRKIAVIFFFTILLFSCEKEKLINVENSDNLLISKVVIGGKSYYEYSYNDANLISEEKSKFHYTRHRYNSRNLLIASDFYYDPAMLSSDSRVAEASMSRKEWVNPFNTAKSLTKSFEYDNNDRLIRVLFDRPSVNNSEYSEVTFENDRISRQSMYWNGFLSFYSDYYYDEKGNLIKESKYHISSDGVAELWTTTEYEYDFMQNPFQSFKRLMIPGKYTNLNNITKETYTIYFEVDQWIQKVHITNNSYEYNDKGYPVKVNGETEYVYK